jgi:hypothetical protein
MRGIQGWALNQGRGHGVGRARGSILALLCAVEDRHHVSWRLDVEVVDMQRERKSAREKGAGVTYEG